MRPASRPPFAPDHSTLLFYRAAREAQEKVRERLTEASCGAATVRGMRIVIVTDAWLPQTNGVVSTLRQTVSCLDRFGHEVLVVNPTMFRSVPCPSYPEIRLALLPGHKLAKTITAFQ